MNSFLQTLALFLILMVAWSGYFQEYHEEEKKEEAMAQFNWNKVEQNDWSIGKRNFCDRHPDNKDCW